MSAQQLCQRPLISGQSERRLWPALALKHRREGHKFARPDSNARSGYVVLQDDQECFAQPVSALACFSTSSASAAGSDIPYAAAFSFTAASAIWLSSMSAFFSSLRLASRNSMASSRPSCLAHAISVP